MLRVFTFLSQELGAVAAPVTADQVHALTGWCGNKHICGGKAVTER